MHEQKASKSLLGSPLVPQTGILQVSQEARNSILQRKGDCHYSVLTATTLDSQDVAKVKEDALGNNKYDNRAPDKISQKVVTNDEKGKTRGTGKVGATVVRPCMF